jgi:cytochrome c peroxidase
VTKVDHTQVTGSCYSCHNGTKATGKPLTHPNTTNTCDACHSTSTWNPITRMDHTQVLGRCDSCHLADKPRDHPSTGGKDCNASGCHTNTRNFTSWNR